MNTEELKEIFERAGYCEHRVPHLSYAKYFLTRVDHTLPECLCNEKPPAIGVYIYSPPKGFEETGPNVEVELVGETPIGWINTRFYSLPAKLSSVQRCAEVLSTLWTEASRSGV